MCVPPKAGSHKGLEGPGKLLFPPLPFLPPSSRHWGIQGGRKQRSLPSRNLHSSGGRQTINKINKNNRVYRTVTSAMERIKQGKGFRMVVRV